MTTTSVASRPTTQHTKARSVPRRVGLVVTGLAATFLAFDAAIHLLNISVVQEATASLGFPAGSAVLIGVVELFCLALYLVPRTSVLGAIALTGYLGGAVTAQLRIEASLFSTLLFPVYVGIAVWVGLWLRDVALQSLVPLRRQTVKA